MGKGEDLNQRVWTLFQDAGFDTKPNSADPATEHTVQLPDGGSSRPVDLFAHIPDLGVSIIGSNKSRKKLKSYTAHIHDLHKLKQAADAKCALFVAAEQEMLERERKFAEKNGVKVWDGQQLQYYESLVGAIGYYAKYEIMHALDIPTTEETLKDTVLAIKLEQPKATAPKKVELYMFTLPADKLLKTCVVLRKAQGSPYAYQRILSRKRLPNIGAFVRSPDALIPTNVIVHLGQNFVIDEIKSDELQDADGNQVEPSRQDHKLVSITFPLKYASLELIDGQHRLFGFVHADEATRKTFNLVVLGVRNLDEKRRNRAFVAINDNARRVDPNLVSYLRYTDDEKVCGQNADLMAIKVVVELNKVSPFRHLIRLFDMGKAPLTLRGLSGYDLKGLVSPKGQLRKFYPNESRRYVRAFRSYFSVVREQFQVEWESPETYIVVTNRGITAFVKLMRSILKTEQKKLTKAAARKYLKALRTHWSGTWETATLKKSYVGSHGWKQFHRDMVGSIRKKYTEFVE